MSIRSGIIPDDNNLKKIKLYLSRVQEGSDILLPHTLADYDLQLTDVDFIHILNMPFFEIILKSK